MMELVDISDLKSLGLSAVRVRFPLRPPQLHIRDYPEDKE